MFFFFFLSLNILVESTNKYDRKSFLCLCGVVVEEEIITVSYVKITTFATTYLRDKL